MVADWLVKRSDDVEKVFFSRAGKHLGAFSKSHLLYRHPKLFSGLLDRGTVLQFKKHIGEAMAKTQCPIYDSFVIFGTRLFMVISKK